MHFTLSRIRSVKLSGTLLIVICRDLKLDRPVVETYTQHQDSYPLIEPFYANSTGCAITNQPIS